MVNNNNNNDRLHSSIQRSDGSAMVSTVYYYVFEVIYPQWYLRRVK